ncbi:MAG: hypothetical protein JW797_09980 [Bradymonadales bacterium]|nr:hypothetical protein [Bradymonadales bacterium]
MSIRKSFVSWLAENSIWGFAFGYFACYVPYSFLTKVLSKGFLPCLHGQRLAGFTLLPVSAIATVTGSIIFLTVARWWKYASHSRVMGLNLPHPTRWTFLSGICTAMIIGTTTLAYTFERVSIVFAMLLMRGGVLIIAPIVDALSRRHVRWFAWLGLGFSMGALLVGLIDNDSYALPLLCAIDIGVYLASYFIRLRFMSRIAKSPEQSANRRYFVEEQMVGPPVLVIILLLGALLGRGTAAGQEIWIGFSAYWDEPYLIHLLLVGFLSMGTGIFGSLVFLDKRENTFCVPVNRSSSILAGVIASYLLMIYPTQRAPASRELFGAAFILVAILFLTIPPMIEKQRARARLAKENAKH